MPEQAYKSCMDCGEVKPLDDFYRHKEMRDGHLNRCKQCHLARAAAHARANRPAINAMQRKWKAENREQAAQATRRWERNNPERIAAKARRSYARHPEKHAARKAVNAAVQEGTLIRPAQCEACGVEPAPTPDGRSQIHGHHPDYSKPLTVEWLCPGCHQARHNEPTISQR